MRHAGFDPALKMYKPRWILGRKATGRVAAARTGIHTPLL